MRTLQLVVVVATLGVAACGGSSRSGGGAAEASSSEHGTVSALSTAGSSDATFCEHRVPGEVCTRHNPQLVGKFKKVGDWCAEHGVPESQCYECHPDLSFAPLPEVPPDADLARLSAGGEDVSSLEANVVPGKVTVFDFYADWCAPCRKIDAHLFALLRERGDIAIRKLNVVSWDTPLAKRHLTNIATLPYVVVYGTDGKLVRAITGLDLVALDRAIADGDAR